jgi:hypothetical protein
MTTSLDDIVNSLSPERRAKIERLTEELFEEVLTLRQLRKKQNKNRKNNQIIEQSLNYQRQIF